jgi:hypothetical protein
VTEPIGAYQYPIPRHQRTWKPSPARPIQRDMLFPTSTQSSSQSTRPELIAGGRRDPVAWRGLASRDLSLLLFLPYATGKAKAVGAPVHGCILRGTRTHDGVRRPILLKFKPIPAEAADAAAPLRCAAEAPWAKPRHRAKSNCIRGGLGHRQSDARCWRSRG